MKTMSYCLFFGFILSLSSTLQGADEKSAAAPVAPNTNAQVTTEKGEYNILKRDQIDVTDTLAIPLDDSEVEDEEEVNRIEGKDLFNLPHSQTK